jgi:hypothetical protein
MDKLSTLINDYQKRHKLGNVLTCAQVVDGANRVSGGKYKAISFKGGRLYVEAEAGPACYFLRQQEENLLEDINTALGDKKVEKIVIRGI